MSSYEQMNQVLKQQKEFFIKNGAPSVDLKIDRLQRLKTLIMDNRYDFIDALNSDFGNRSKNASMLSDIYGIMPAINLAIKNVKKWSKPEKKSSNLERSRSLIVICRTTTKSLKVPNPDARSCSYCFSALK